MHFSESVKITMSSSTVSLILVAVMAFGCVTAIPPKRPDPPQQLLGAPVPSIYAFVDDDVPDIEQAVLLDPATPTVGRLTNRIRRYV